MPPLVTLPPAGVPSRAAFPRRVARPPPASRRAPAAFRLRARSTAERDDVGSDDAPEQHAPVVFTTDEAGNMVDPSVASPSFATLSAVISRLAGSDASSSSYSSSSSSSSSANRNLPRTKRRKRALGETASFIRRQGSSLFGIAEGLGLQYRLGVYNQVDDELLDDDPGLNQLLVSPGTSVSQLFDQDMWERHRGVSRYWRHLASMPTSTVFQRILEPVLILTAWAFFCAAWNGAVVPAVVAAGESAADATAGAALLERLAGVAGGAQITRVLALWASNAIPLATASVAHSLAGVALGLVLVFRTNSSFARLTEARVLLGNMVRCARDLARLAVYVPGDSDDGARARTVVVGYAASIGFALEAHVRRGRTREDPDDPTAFRVDPRTQLERVVGAETADAYVSGGGNVPLRMHAATSLALRDALACGMPRGPHHQAEELVSEMGKIVGGAERIQSTPIAISYTRHTSRSLMLWLLTLPFALWPTMGWASVPAQFLVTYMMLGIDEIGVQIEEPFGVLPVKPLAEVCERDVRALDQQLGFGCLSAA